MRTAREWQLGFGPWLQALLAVNLHVLVDQRTSVPLPPLARVRFLVHAAMVLVPRDGKRLPLSPQVPALPAHKLRFASRPPDFRLPFGAYTNSSSRLQTIKNTKNQAVSTAESNTAVRHAHPGTDPSAQNPYSFPNPTRIPVLQRT